MGGSHHLAGKMENWINTPLILTVAAGLVYALISIGKWVGSVNSDRSKFNEFIKEIRSKLDKILDRLPPIAVSSGSPLRLTEFGEKIAKQINAEEWSVQLASKVATAVEGKTPYEIQQFCLNYVQELEISSEQHEVLYNCAYENGMDVKTVRRVLGIVLRDKLLDTATLPKP